MHTEPVRRRRGRRPLSREEKLARLDELRRRQRAQLELELRYLLDR